MTITLKYPGKCDTCGAKLPKGVTAEWTGRGKVHCSTCKPAEKPRADYIDVDRLYEDDCARRCGF